MENLLFYEKIKELKALVTEDQDRCRANTTMQSICNEFIDPNAINSLNIPGKIRDGLLEKLNRGQLLPEDFDPLLKDVLELIYRNNFPRFVEVYQDRVDGSISHLET